MAASGPTIVAKFLADTSKMTSEVSGATSTMSGKLSSFAKTAALTIGGAFAVNAIVDFGKAAVNAAAEDAEAQEKLANTLRNVTGATDEQVAAQEKYIENLSKQAAIADDDLRPAFDKLVRGFGNTADAQEALTLATDVAAGTGKDLASVTDAMMKAAQGNTGALKKMGIEVKNADGSAKSLDEIMADMAKTFEGQAASAADTTAGKMRAAKIQFGEFQEQIGTYLLPVIGTLAAFFTEKLIPALSGIADWVAGHKDVILAAFVGFATVVGTVVVPAFIGWATTAGAAAAATLLAAAPFIALGAVIAGVAYLIIHNWDDIVAGAKKCWDAVMGAIRFVWDWIKSNWPLLLTILTGPFGAAVWAIQSNWDSIKGAAVTVYNWLRDTWSAVTGFITAPITTAASTIAGLWTDIKNGATGVYNWIKEKFDSIAGAINGALGGISSAVSGVVNAIKNPINAVIRGWNAIEFVVPSISLPKVDLGPFGTVGGGTYGGQRFGFPTIPQLARGGVLTAPTLFVGGEAGTEIVTPERLLRQIIAEEGGGNTYQLIMQPRTADAQDVAYGFRRLELLAGI